MSALYYEAVQIGTEIPPLSKYLALPVMMRWCAAVEIFRRDHWDRDYAKNHEGLPDAVLSTGFKQASLYQLIKNWAGENGWVWKMSYRDQKMIHADQTITAFGKVVNKSVKDGLGYIDLEIGLRISDGSIAAPGSATVVLPLKGGRAVPYPFKP